MSGTLNRRKVLRGIMGGTAVSVGLPLLDCFLNGNGTALASGAPLPTCFGTWFWGCGLQPGHWVPRVAGPNYEMAPQLEVLAPFKDKINIYSGLAVNLGGRANQAHGSGPAAILKGVSPGPGAPKPPSIDTLISGAIGTKTRFRSLEIAANGIATSSFSNLGGSVTNPAETSPLTLYTRIFGPEFMDPNAAAFKPDPAVMVRRSALSAVTEEREGVMRKLGASDRVRLDEYFTSLRAIEQQLDLQLQKPAPLEACSVPGAPEGRPTNPIIDNVLVNNKLFAGLLAHALACGQTRVVNMVFSPAVSDLRTVGSADIHHIFTHVEAVDPALGYQPNVWWFQARCMEGFLAVLQAFDAVREGDGTLLDRTLLFASTDTGYAKAHSVINIPLFTAGRANGRVKTGIHYSAPGDTVTRVGLTIQQALGLPINSWGLDANHTSNTITEVLA